MKSILNIITILLFSLSPMQIGLANEDMDAESLIKAYIESRQDPNQKPLKYVTDEQLKNSNPQKLLAFLAIYDSNESYTVRSLALSFEFSIANIHPTEDIRKEATYR